MNPDDDSKVAVVVFCYNRPKMLQKVLNSLVQKNSFDQLKSGVLYIFSDGSKNEKNDKIKCDKVNAIINNFINTYKHELKIIF